MWQVWQLGLRLPQPLVAARPRHAQNLNLTKVYSIFGVGAVTGARPNLGDHRQTRFSQFRGISSATRFRKALYQSSQ